MNQNSLRKWIIILLIVASAGPFSGSAVSFSNTSRPFFYTPQPAPKAKSDIVSLRDFTRDEVRSAGMVLSKDLKVHVSAAGGGERSFWRDNSDENESQQMYAAGWIIDADTREIVWDMTRENTSGRANRRTCDLDISLKKGSYEVYYMAYGYSIGGAFSGASINIDRRQSHRTPNRVIGGIINFFRGDEGDLYEEFMDLART